MNPTSFLAPVPGHHITVTKGVFGRVFFDCECGLIRRYASPRPAQRAALTHYLDHAADSPDKNRAARLLNPTQEGTPA